ncbi:Fic family protein [Thomasclavelia saccharogumia]|uniref:Fic family protein n=1 Tax=Thomasclavelia saccharogumia TaxID=341225 RepID=UPI000479340C|nr:Fic family protein [Thomasclavelia saccharogumia]
MIYKTLEKQYHYTNSSEFKKIYQNKINNETAINFNITINKNPAFMIVNHEILQLVSQIYHLNNKIIEKCNDLPGIARQYFIKNTLIEEIIKTNEIEGIHSTKKELKEVYENVINKNLKKKKSRFYGLVNKYNSLINNEYLKLTTCDSIRKLYDEIMLVDVINESSDNQPDGEIFRKEAVEVISEYDGAIHKGIMPEIEIINYMNEGLKILNDQAINIFIRIAVFHYLFGYIHPFYDGNGRMSRYISSLYLNDELDILCALQLSISCKERKNDYYRAFKFTNDVRNKADLTGFVIIFLEIIVTGLENLLEIVSDKLEQYNLNKKMLKEICDKEDVYHLLNVFLQCTLFDNEGLSYYDLMNITNLSRTTIINKIKDIKNSSLKDLLIERKISREKHYQLNIDKLYDMV